MVKKEEKKQHYSHSLYLYHDGSLCSLLRLRVMFPMRVFLPGGFAHAPLPVPGGHPGASCRRTRARVCSQLSPSLFQRWHQMDHLEGPLVTGGGKKSHFLFMFFTVSLFLDLHETHWQREHCLSQDQWELVLVSEIYRSNSVT